MRSLALTALPRARGYQAVATATTGIQAWATRRTFSSLPSLRPTILASKPPNSAVFRSPSAPNGLLSSFTPSPTSLSASGITLDLVPRTAITSHPSLSFGAQARFGPRPTMARTSRLVRKRRHGFLSRVRTHNGRKTLQRRKEKKRSMLSN
ncbi:hypothetical protein F5Y13DRAFT_158895 [Hypoxylon sp. FL1857]|nr:hypothetical protein F5Y13DRAFT_158895 [Hypoxylon sp. FL1857]